MKRILLYLLGITSTLLFVVMFSLAGILFFRPLWILNPKTIDMVLKKTHILKSWSWKEGEFEHQWVNWNRRIVKGHFKDLCFEYENPTIAYATCFETISWNFELSYTWKEGFFSKSKEPIFIRSNDTKVALKENQAPNTKSSPPDIWSYWNLFWSNMVPDIDGYWKKIQLTFSGKSKDFALKLIKSPQRLKVEGSNLTLLANPTGFELLLPKKYRIPKKISFLNPLYFTEAKLKGEVRKHEISIHLTGEMASLGFDITTKLDLPVKEAFTSLNFRKKIILQTKAKIHMPDIKKSLATVAKDPYRELPAPINAMNGGIEFNLHSESMKNPEMVLIKSSMALKMQGGKQVLDLAMGNEVPLNVMTFKPGSVLVGIDFNKVSLQLPRISKKSLPPQFLPDSRFKKVPYQKPVKTEPKIDLALHLEGLDSEAMMIKTDLLDEILRLNFDLYIDKGQLKKGFISMLPLKTTVFRRPIHIKSFKINFNYPHPPVIMGQIVFPLPEYKISLELEGPISKPRYKFRSDPPLGQNDIYSVLLFGRPMDDLNQSDKSNAQKTNQILAQGILSLSVLYFFAGSPVEYIGFDPGSGKATAQFGINSKTSLNIGRDQEGVNSSGIRKSIGKGWYLDTTVQSPSSSSSSTQKNLGVILERVMAY